jgi:hypothetical protein
MIRKALPTLRSAGSPRRSAPVTRRVRGEL